MRLWPTAGLDVRQGEGRAAGFASVFANLSQLTPHP